MMAVQDLAELFESNFEAYVAAMNRRLRVLDAAIAEKAAIEDPGTFRERVEAEAIEALAALGVERPETTWRLGVLATRVWLLEIASPPVTSLLETRRAMESNPYIAPESPAGQWWLWVHVFYLGLGVFEARRARRFGKPEFTIADLEEARNTAQIPNEQWLAIRKRAAWVYAP